MVGDPILPAKVSDPPKWLIEKKQLTIADCPILYTGKTKYAKKQDAHFPWECNDGWNDVIANLSYDIEALNLIYYPKYRVRCQIEQIKEKFGTLRVYTHIVTDPPAWRTVLPDFLTRILQWLKNRNLNYDIKKIIDRDYYTKYEYKQLTETEYNLGVANKYKCSNEEFFKEGDRYYKVTAYERFGEFHYTPTRYVFIYKLKQAIEKLISRLYAWSIVEPTTEQRVISEHMENVVRQYEIDAESKCYNKCEICGTEIGTSWNARCRTSGHISYICESCAKQQHRPYTKCQEKNNEDQI